MLGICLLEQAELLITEWRTNASLTLSELVACDSLANQVLAPLSDTSTYLIAPFTQLTTVSSRSPSFTSLPSVKRGRHRLHKCDKHRRWKKTCPLECPDRKRDEPNDHTLRNEDQDEANKDKDDVSENQDKEEETKFRRQSMVSSTMRNTEEQSILPQQSIAHRGFEQVGTNSIIKPSSNADAFTRATVMFERSPRSSSPHRLQSRRHRRRRRCRRLRLVWKRQHAVP